MIKQSDKAHGPLVKGLSHSPICTIEKKNTSGGNMGNIYMKCYLPYSFTLLLICFPAEKKNPHTQHRGIVSQKSNYPVRASVLRNRIIQFRYNMYNCLPWYVVHVIGSCLFICCLFYFRIFLTWCTQMKVRNKWPWSLDSLESYIRNMLFPAPSLLFTCYYVCSCYWPLCSLYYMIEFNPAAFLPVVKIFSSSISESERC